jgi:DNA polymerase I-like protein with 3'-5' exonuclease and polymerase domains
MWWENEFVKVVGDMEMTGVRIDKEKWYAIADHVQPIYDEALEKLNTILKEDFWDVLEANDWVSNTDTLTTNVWSSSAKKKVILDELFEFEIEKTAKTELKKLLELHDPDFPKGLSLNGKAWTTSDYPTTFTSKYAILKLMILGANNGNVLDTLNKFLLTNMRAFAIEQGWIRPAGQLSLNWASPIQRLKIFQAVNPAIESTGKDVLVDYEADSRVIPTYLGWNDVAYQLKNFGKPFYDNHVELDGKHRTRFNQVLQTGRLSSVSPNMLNIPRKAGKGIYRAAVIPDPGFELIDADYDGQELVITTELSQEPSWMAYSEKGFDLHSKNADLIFGEEWRVGAEPDCAYYAQDDQGFAKFKKCSCKVHEELRDASKAVSFGSIYGISYFKLAFNLKISEDRAKFILKRFFEIVPKVREMMDNFGRFAIENGFIIEPVFGRIRYFDLWKLSVAQEHGSIERAAFNTPIQSAGSSILKIAFVLMRRWINHNNLQDHIQLLLPYHDETIAQARITEDRYYINLAKEKIEHYMKLGALLGGFKVGAGAKSGASWLEAH